MQAIKQLLPYSDHPIPQGSALPTKKVDTTTYIFGDIQSRRSRCHQIAETQDRCLSRWMVKLSRRRQLDAVRVWSRALRRGCKVGSRSRGAYFYLCFVDGDLDYSKVGACELCARSLSKKSWGW